MLRAVRALDGYFFAERAVEVRAHVDELPVVVEIDFAAVLLEFLNPFFEGFVAALSVVGRVFGVACVHALLPPAEHEDSVDARLFARLADFGQLVVAE